MQIIHFEYDLQNEKVDLRYESSLFWRTIEGIPDNVFHARPRCWILFRYDITWMCWKRRCSGLTRCSGVYRAFGLSRRCHPCQGQADCAVWCQLGKSILFILLFQTCCLLSLLGLHMHYIYMQIWRFLYPDYAFMRPIRDKGFYHDYHRRFFLRGKYLQAAIGPPKHRIYTR